MALAYTAHGAQAGSATAAMTSGAVTVTAAAGDTILVAVATASGGSAPTATDSAGGVYRIVAGPSTNTDNVWLLVRTIPCSGSVTTVTVSWTGSAQWSVAIGTWSGVQGFGNVNNSATGSSTAPSIALVGLGPGDWIVAGMFNTGTGTWTAATGNLRTNIAGAGSTTPGAALMDNTTVTCTATLSASSLWGACAVALLSAPVPPGTARMAMTIALAAWSAWGQTVQQFRRYTLIDEPIPPGAFRRDPVPWIPAEWSPQHAASVAALIPVVAKVSARRDAVPWTPLDWTTQAAAPVAPLTLAYGQQPPRIGGSPLSVPNASAIQQPAPTWPAQSGPTIAPLTLPAGQQPPRWAWRDGPGILRAWVVDWPAQRMAPVAAWGGSVPVPPFVPFRRDPVPWIELTWPAQSEGDVAPVTLVYGQQPPRRPPGFVPPWPAPDWAAQWIAPSAAWNLSGSDLVGGSPWGLWISLTVPWPAPDWAPQRSALIAPIALVYGQQPPRQLLTLPPALAWPPLDWPAQSEADNAPWNQPPPSVHYVPPPFPAAILPAWVVDWRSQAAAPVAAFAGTVAVPVFPYRRDPVPWVPLDWGAQRAAVIAPLTLPTGQQPPPWSWRTGPTLLRWWEIDWPAQRGPQIVPLSLPTGQQPPRRTLVLLMHVHGLWLPAIWDAQRHAPVAAWMPPPSPLPGYWLVPGGAALFVVGGFGGWPLEGLTAGWPSDSSEET